MVKRARGEVSPDVRELIPEVHRALDDARVRERAEIREALEASNFVGVEGEAEVGKTALVARALRDAQINPVRIDLAAAASEAHLAHIIARALARVLIAPPDYSLLSGTPDLAPSSARSARLHLERVLGADLTQLALSGTAKSDASLQSAIEAIGAVAELQHSTVWIDHVESPGLTSRHPVDPFGLLWSLRATAQRTPFAVVVTANGAVTDDVAGPKGAFHMDGTWVRVDRPSPSAWASVCDALGLHISEVLLTDLLRLLECYPPATIMAIVEVAGLRQEGHPLADDIVRRLASLDDGTARLTLAYARGLHRLGGEIIERVAHRVGPYVDRGPSKPEDVRRAVLKLRRAGLISQVRPSAYRLTNPLVAMRLRGTLNEPGGTD